MRIIVQLFASLRDAVGARQVEMEVPEAVTPLQIAEQLAQQHPKLRPHLPSISIVKELALLPPVSGG
jgi:molybdopterin converting factor small subunit